MVQKEDFWIPFSFAERKPFLLDQCLYIPTHYEEHTSFSEFSIEKLALNKPIYLELCSGNGQWILEKAAQNPSIFWVGVEKKFDRARNIWYQAQKRNLSNVFIVYGEALTFLQYYVPQTVIERLFINFPDPWPKVKHAKNRLIQPSFCQEVEKVLLLRGQLFFVTDHKSYMDKGINTFLQNTKLQPIFPYPYYLTDWQDFGDSFFKNLFQSKNCPIFYLGLHNHDS